MSYLIGPRLHFAGKFQADVSTVNNNSCNFTVATTDPPPLGQSGFNPNGTGDWCLKDCLVKSVVFADGRQLTTAADDPVIGQAIGSISPIAAKIVDLDPDQQGVSQIWGMTVGLGAPAAPLLKASYEPAAFTDMWIRVLNAPRPADPYFSAVYQSVLSSLAWGDISASPFLQALRAAAGSSLLSIKFMVDGYQADKNPPADFTWGRIVGTIGIALAAEPHQFVLGRHGQRLGPPGQLQSRYFSAVVDANRGKVVADLGNFFQTVGSGGDISIPPDLRLGVARAGGAILELGPVNPPALWYTQSAGLWETPANRALTAQELDEVGRNPIVIYQGDPAHPTVMASEPSSGLHVRADNCVFRMSPGDTAVAELTVTKFGQPVAGQTVEFQAIVMPQGGPTTPAIGVTVPASAVSGADGKISLTLTAHDPGPQGRRHIDGQVYMVGYGLAGPQNPDDFANQWDTISVLVWSAFNAPAAPTWRDDIYRIFKQYADLYPYMRGLIDLSDYQAVVNNKDAIATVFRLPVSDPHYMPVTRDLSPAKRQMLLSWLASAVPAEGTKPQVASLGGKAAFFERRSASPSR